MSERSLRGSLEARGRASAPSFEGAAQGSASSARLKQGRLQCLQDISFSAANFGRKNTRVFVIVTERIFGYRMLLRDAKFYHYNARNSISAGNPPQTRYGNFQRSSIFSSYCGRRKRRNGRDGKEGKGTGENGWDGIGGKKGKVCLVFAFLCLN